jgi:ABC-type sugar transport system ATPase subunit
VFLLDEPLSNLDAPVRAGMRSELKRLQQRVGTTMLYVTHDQVEALTLGDLVAVLDHGTIQQVGAPDEIFRRPANRLVASFVGSPGMNVVPAIVDGQSVVAGPFRLRPRGLAKLEREVLDLGFRPGSIEVGPPSKGKPAEVELVEISGEDSYIHLSAEDVRLVATVSADTRPTVGDKVGVTIKPGDVYLFDAETGETLLHPA